MRISLIVCTYQRPGEIISLLTTVAFQSHKPFEIIVVDGSLDNQTQEVLLDYTIDGVVLHYFLVNEHYRGLTRQRNFGLDKVSDSTQIVSFLDDDIELEADYFEKIVDTFIRHPEALGVGGYITNATDSWQIPTNDHVPSQAEYSFDGWVRKDGSRFVLRKRLGLDSDRPPGFLPDFSHGRSIGFLPPSGLTYEVGQFMGGVANYRRSVFDRVQFSTFFEGYGLYEDADFTIRLSRFGKLYVNTAARCAHYHAPSGRPNQFKYGRMVVRNGWYVWRVAHPSPSIGAKIKWHQLTLLLSMVRLANTLTGPNRVQAFTEALGRLIAWVELFFRKPSMT